MSDPYFPWRVSHQLHCSWKPWSVLWATKKPTPSRSTTPLDPFALNPSFTTPSNNRWVKKIIWLLDQWGEHLGIATKNSPGFPNDDQKSRFNIIGKWKRMVCDDVCNKIGQRCPDFLASVTVGNMVMILVMSSSQTSLLTTRCIWPLYSSAPDMFQMFPWDAPWQSAYFIGPTA